MSPGRRLAIDYLAIQGVAGIAWWIGLVASPTLRDRFTPSGFPPDFILTYWLPDATLFIGGSLAGAALLWRHHRTARPMLFVCAGATLYAFLHCLAIAASTRGFVLGAVMMAPPATLTTILAITLGQDPPELPRMRFTPAPESPTSRIWRRTLVQTVIFWIVFLVLVPGFILWVEASLGVVRFALPGRRLAGPLLFVAGGTLGVWSSRTMVLTGRGTPLPTSSPRRLVVSGPYRFIRNPMAVGGLLQGIAVGVFFGSPFTIVYVLVGAFLWNHTIRPAEEADLLARFGDEFRAYARRVPCWLPIARRGSAAPDGA